MSFGSTIGKNITVTKELRQCWRTPPELFAGLHKIFGFTLDACASNDNALLPRFWTEQDDCRLQDWSSDVVFCNPPFGNTASILAKAATARSALFVLPVTALTTRYLAKYPPTVLVVPCQRVKFDPPLGLPSGSNPTLGSVFLVYGAICQKQIAELNEMGFLTFFKK